MNVLFLKNFVSTKECVELNAWVDMGVQNKWLSFGHNTETGKRDYARRLTTRSFEDRFKFLPLVHEVSERITTRLGLNGFKKSDNGNEFGVVATSMQDGGSVITHVDPKENNGISHVLRCNVVTRRALQGGELVIGGNKIPLEVGDLHCYLVTLLPHSVTKVEGNVSRVLWMFGYQMSEKDFFNLKIK